MAGRLLGDLPGRSRLAGRRGGLASAASSAGRGGGSRRPRRRLAARAGWAAALARPAGFGRPGRAWRLGRWSSQSALTPGRERLGAVGVARLAPLARWPRSGRRARLPSGWSSDASPGPVRSVPSSRRRASPPDASTGRSDPRSAGGRPDPRLSDGRAGLGRDLGPKHRLELGRDLAPRLVAAAWSILARRGRRPDRRSEDVPRAAGPTHPGSG